MCGGDFLMAGPTDAASVQTLGAKIGMLGAASRGLSEYAYAHTMSRQAGMDARAEVDAAEAAAGKIRRATRAAVGETRVGFAAAGVDPSSATARALEADVQQRGEEDALTAILTGQRRADEQRRLAGQYGDAAVTAVGGSLLRVAEHSLKWRGAKRGPNVAADYGNGQGGY